MVEYLQNITIGPTQNANLFVVFARILLTVLQVRQGAFSRDASNFIVLRRTYTHKMRIFSVAYF